MKQSCLEKTKSSTRHELGDMIDMRYKIKAIVVNPKEKQLKKSSAPLTNIQDTSSFNMLPNRHNFPLVAV
jgi:hypothetical protein